MSITRVESGSGKPPTNAEPIEMKMHNFKTTRGGSFEWLMQIPDSIKTCMLQSLLLQSRGRHNRTLHTTPILPLPILKSLMASPTKNIRSANQQGCSSNNMGSIHGYLKPIINPQSTWPKWWKALLYSRNYHYFYSCWNRAHYYPLIPSHNALWKHWQLNEIKRTKYTYRHFQLQISTPRKMSGV